MMRTFECQVYLLKNGVRYRALKPTESCTVYASSSSKIKTSLSGRFLAEDKADWMVCEIQPVMLIDGREYPVGIFRAATLTRDTGDQGSIDEIEAFDRGWLLQQAKTEKMLHLAAGTNYIEAVEMLMALCGISMILKTPTSYTLQTDREDWEIGTDYLTIVNQLLSEINYRDVWFNADGFAVLEPALPPSAANIRHTYDAEDIRSMLHRECSVKTDLFNKPNVFVVICSNPDLDDVMTAVAENNDPLSPTSTISRKMRITSVTKVDNIASQQALQTYANELCSRSRISGETVTIKTAIMPGHGIGDTIALNHPDVKGLYEETGWYLDLKAGEYMTHDLKKVVYEWTR